MIYNIFDIHCNLVLAITITMATRAAEEDLADNYGRWLLGGDYLTIELAV